jgi:MFS-type transporter involved in bile tolerance (Atg22 family)
VQGMPYGLQTRYLPIIMRINGISLSELGFFKLLLIPWILKFFISAFIVDSYKTKRFWLLASLTLLCVGSFIAAFIAEKSYLYLAIIMFFLNIASTTQDICVDWFAINLLDKDDLGLGNTIQVSGFKMGTLFTGGLIVWLIDYIQLKLAFTLIGFIYAFCLFLLNLSIFNIEREKEKKEKHVATGNRLKNILFNVPGTIWMCCFLLIYKLGEQSSLSMLPMYLIDNKVPSSTIGLWTGVLGQCASIFGSCVAGICLKKTFKR